MRVSTTRCGKLGHPEFILEADESAVPDVYLKGMAETMEGMVANGSIFRPGQTLQVACMITQVRPHGAAHLTLFEPDMKIVPIEWVPGITETLRQKMVQ